jgi:hypothetical protein
MTNVLSPETPLDTEGQTGPCRLYVSTALRSCALASHSHRSVVQDRVAVEKGAS